MKSIICLTIIIASVFQISYSQQNDTVFYDIKWEVVEDRNNASYFGFSVYDAEKEVYIQTDYYISGKIQMKGEYKSIELDVKHGHFIWYNKDGSISSEKDYKDNILISEIPLDFDIEDNEPMQFYVVEEQPEFPGGESAMLVYISKNIKYPALAVEMGIQGKVYISFFIDKDGSVKDVRVRRGVDPYLDKEAVRVIESMPKWKPGKQKGKAIKVQYHIPINFRLKEE